MFALNKHSHPKAFVPEYEVKTDFQKTPLKSRRVCNLSRLLERNNSLILDLFNIYKDSSSVRAHCLPKNVEG